LEIPADFEKYKNRIKYNRLWFKYWNAEHNFLVAINILEIGIEIVK